MTTTTRQQSFTLDANQKVRETALYTARDMQTIVKAAQAVFDAAIECMNQLNPPADVLEARRKNLNETLNYLNAVLETVATTNSARDLKAALTQAITDTKEAERTTV